MRFSCSTLVPSQNALIEPARRVCRVLSYAAILPYQRRRTYATTTTSTAPASTEPQQQRVAILGAGITALSAAYHLLRTPHPPKITIYEKSDGVGGWIRSKYVDLENGKGRVLFETGPRNIRPVVPLGLATLALWEEIGLAGNIISTPKSSVAAKRRWLYYPDHLVELPNADRGVLRNLWSLFTEPAFKGYLMDMAYELGKEPRSAQVEDESAGAFISRRVNKNMVNQVASAVMHGVYAGDIWELSARSVLGDAWWAEQHSGSVFKGMMTMQGQGWMKRRHAELLEHLTVTGTPSAELMLDAAKASTMTLDGGLEMFPQRVAHVLQSLGHVEIKTGTEVKSISMADNEGIQITTSSSSSSPQRFDQIISTVPSKTLSYLTLSETNPDSLTSLAQTPFVNVNVVNLFYTEANLLPISGFGYLIPQATPLENNPELALGVVFDSDVIPYGQDKLEILDTSKAEQPHGTKLTVMLGGHWYNAFDTMPDERTALQQAKDVVKRHLGITAQPAASLVSQQRDAIPQYTVGHVSRLRAAHNELLRRFGGRLKVVGSSFGGVGINDCVVGGMEIAGLAAGAKSNWANKTGLEWAMDGGDMDYVRGPEYLKERGLGDMMAKRQAADQQQSE